MKKMVKLTIALVLFVLHSKIIHAQINDSVKTNYSENITTRENTEFNDIAKYNNSSFSCLKLKHYALPAALFTYGLIAPIFKNNTSDKNYKQKIVMNRPHAIIPIDNYTQYIPAAAVYALNISGNKGAHNLKDASIILLTSHVVTTISVQAMKHITGRVRPDSSSNRSFPSGHTAEAFSNATFLWYEYKHKSVWYGIAGYAIAATTGYLRMYNNKHWLSDIAAGAGIGIASMNFSYWLYPKISKKIFKSKNTNTILIPSYNYGNISLNFVKRF